ncbi:hypothetical protein EVAR_100251_1 [Eumeta japonica]|uniref:Uncharacterized protein n=1 Tax=Eumeta variegata TaxID=151549 RepID=A0A4C2ABE3_EUMVA|nr:hypothetical protein EVAR_100251_1 [Eumeta japonica]
MSLRQERYAKIVPRGNVLTLPTILGNRSDAFATEPPPFTLHSDVKAMHFATDSPSFTVHSDIEATLFATDPPLFTVQEYHIYYKWTLDDVITFMFQIWATSNVIIGYMGIEPPRGQRRETSSRRGRRLGIHSHNPCRERLRQ